VLFVFQYVAVPDVVISAGPRADWRPRGNLEVHYNFRHVSGVHSDGFFPPHFVGIGRPRRPVEFWSACVVLGVERLPFQDLHVHQVDRVGITGEIEDRQTSLSPARGVSVAVSPKFLGRSRQTA
jgi:hypothetical protein